MEDETAEKTVDNMIDKVSTLFVVRWSNANIDVSLETCSTLCQILLLKKRLIRLKQMMLKHYLNWAHLVPDPKGIDVQKLQEAMFALDTCSMAQKERRMFIERVGGIG